MMKRSGLPIRIGASDWRASSYRSFGESTEDAIAHAARRVEAIRAKAAKLGNAPYRETLHPEIMPDLRHVTIDQAIYWLFVDEDALIVRVLAIFFGGYCVTDPQMEAEIGRINAALARICVERAAGKDEFDTIGLADHRSFSDLFKKHWDL